MDATSLGVIFTALIVASIVVAFDRFFLGSNRIDPCDEKIRRFKRELELDYDKKFAKIKEEHEKEIAELKRQIQFLLDTLVAQKNLLQPTIHKKDEEKVLLACGGVSRFCSTDSRVLRRSHINFTTITDATTTRIASEIRRALQDGNPYTAIHISAHSDGQSIELAGETISSEELELAILTIDLIVISACSSHDIADKLAERGRSIITFLEDVDDDVAEESMYIFWRAIKAGETPKSAYESTRSMYPQIADKIGFRGGNR